MSGRRLVVFGAGYVGSAVAHAARARGMEVTALTRNPEKAAALTLAGVRTVVADLGSANWHAQLSPDTEFILNCVSSGGGGLDGYRKSYVDGQRSILDWVRTTPSPGILVYTGSTTVYPQDGGIRVSEEASTAESTGNARVLLEAEDLVRAWAGRWFILGLPAFMGLVGTTFWINCVRNRHAGRARGASPQPDSSRRHRDGDPRRIHGARAGRERGLQCCGRRGHAQSDGGQVDCYALVPTAAGVFRRAGEGAADGDAGSGDRNDQIKRVLGWSPRYPSFRDGYAAFLDDPPA